MEKISHSDFSHVRDSHSVPVGILNKLNAISLDILPYFSTTVAIATIVTQATLAIGGLTLGTPILATAYLASAAYAIFAKKEHVPPQAISPYVSHSSSAPISVAHSKSGLVSESINRISHKTIAFGREVFSPTGFIRSATAVMTIGMIAAGGFGLPLAAKTLLACTTLACGSLAGGQVAKLFSKDMNKRDSAALDK